MDTSMELGLKQWELVPFRLLGSFAADAKRHASQLRDNPTSHLAPARSALPLEVTPPRPCKCKLLATELYKPRPLFPSSTVAVQ
jgi:hypothetical protein